MNKILPQLLVIIKIISFGFVLEIFAERRPLKTTHTPLPLFRSPSARLVQHDKLLLDDAYRGSDGSIIGTLGGLSNKEVHHYTFQPSKQIVSNGFLIYEYFTHCQACMNLFIDTCTVVCTYRRVPLQINSQLKHQHVQRALGARFSVCAHNATIINDETGINVKYLFAKFITAWMCACNLNENTFGFYVRYTECPAASVCI